MCCLAQPQCFVRSTILVTYHIDPLGRAVSVQKQHTLFVLWAAGQYVLFCFPGCCAQTKKVGVCPPVYIDVHVQLANLGYNHV